MTAGRFTAGAPRVAIAILIAASMLACIVAYWPATRAGFYFDDEPNIVDAPATHWREVSLSNMSALAEGAHLPSRPVSNFTFALNHRFAGLSPAGYHWTNIAIHLMAWACLVWIAQMLVRRSPREMPARESLAIALAASSLFLLHPLNTQAVTYVVQRMTSLATLFTLLSLALYMRGRSDGPAGRRTAAFLGAALSWVMGMGSKEIAFILPALILAYEAAFYRDQWKNMLTPGSRNAVARASVAALLVLGAGLAAAMWFAYGGSDAVRWTERFPDRDFSGYERVLTQSRIQFFYLGLLLWPDPGRLSLEHDFPLSTSLVEPWTTLPAVLAWTAIVVLGVWLMRTRPRYGFPVVAYLLLHLIESAPISLELVFEHRMYLPMSALVWLAAVILADLPRRVRHKAMWAMAIVAPALAFATYHRNLVWADPFALYHDSASKAPGSFRPHYNLGTFLGQSGRLAQAERALLHALALEPRHSGAHNQLGNTYLLLGRLDRAEDHYARAVEFEPRNLEAVYNLASLLDRKREFDRAIPLYERFIAEAPPAFHQAKAFAQTRLGAVRSLAAGASDHPRGTGTQ